MSEKKGAERERNGPERILESDIGLVVVDQSSVGLTGLLNGDGKILQLNGRDDLVLHSVIRGGSARARRRRARGTYPGRVTLRTSCLKPAESQLTGLPG